MEFYRHDPYHYGATWDKEKIEHMKRLRYKKWMTLGEIGKEFGISRERVRQLIKNENDTGLKKRRYLVRNEDPLLTDEEVARKYNLCVNTVKQLREIRITNKWHKWAIRLLKMRGHIVDYGKHANTPIVVVNDSIKVMVCSASGMRPSPSQKTINPKYRFRVNKRKDEELIDIYLCVMKDCKEVFVIPGGAVPFGKFIVFCWPSAYRGGKYQKYHNRFDLLKGKE